MGVSTSMRVISLIVIRPGNHMMVYLFSSFMFDYRNREFTLLTEIKKHLLSHHHNEYIAVNFTALAGHQ